MLLGGPIAWGLLLYSFIKASNAPLDLKLNVESHACVKLLQGAVAKNQ